MYKAKSTKDIYIGSFAINSENLGKQLASRSVPPSEIKIIIDELCKLYNENVDAIVQECDKDLTALERVPSPLKLFIECLNRIQKTKNLSRAAKILMQKYVLSWEDWM